MHCVADRTRQHSLRDIKLKCLAAYCVVIIFSNLYRSHFTKSLQEEAGVILYLRRTKRAKMYVLDPAEHSQNDLRVNIIDKSGGGMGNIDAWVQFVTPRVLEMDMYNEDALPIKY